MKLVRASMTTSLKRIAAAVIAGVTAAIVIASPALAVKPVENPALGFRQIELRSDDGSVLAGYVRVTKLSNGLYDVWACDRNVDGKLIIARVDRGDGAPVNFYSTGAENDCSFHQMTVAKFRLGWGTFDTVTYLTPKWYAPRS